MAKKNTSSKFATKSSPSKKPTTSPVRNTALPKVQPMPSRAGNSSTMNHGSGTKRTITQEMIAKRAYEIWASGKGGSQQDNWHRAERELRGQSN